jgi:hypothetical protein
MPLLTVDGLAGDPVYQYVDGSGRSAREKDPRDYKKPAVPTAPLG